MLAQQFMRIPLIIMFFLLLQGCVNVATTGAQAVYNRHSIEKNLSDQVTTMRVHEALTYKTHAFRNANISIATLNGEVLLAGQAPESWQRDKAGEIANQIPNVKKVYNLITVASPSSAMTRVSDTWLTTKVKTKLIASNDVDATQIKVVTENGTVYLMGILKPEDAQAAVDIARETDGVQSVVKIFSYISISKTINKTLT
jgi:osmotically-inducible protein OsmY